MCLCAKLCVQGRFWLTHELQKAEQKEHDPQFKIKAAQQQHYDLIYLLQGFR